MWSRPDERESGGKNLQTVMEEGRKPNNKRDFLKYMQVTQVVSRGNNNKPNLSKRKNLGGK